MRAQSNAIGAASFYKQIPEEIKVLRRKNLWKFFAEVFSGRLAKILMKLGGSEI